MGIHKRHGHVANEPSKMDIELLMELYGTCNLNQAIIVDDDKSINKCTIMGPPLPPEVDHDKTNQQVCRGTVHAMY